MKRMFWGVYKCPDCGKRRFILNRNQYEELVICVTDEAIGYHLYGERAPRRCKLGFTGYVLCKRCREFFYVDKHNYWKKK